MSFLTTEARCSKIPPDESVNALCLVYRLYSDIEAIIANLLLNKQKEDREVGYGGACSKHGLGDRHSASLVPRVLTI